MDCIRFRTKNESGQKFTQKDQFKLDFCCSHSQEKADLSHIRAKAILLKAKDKKKQISWSYSSKWSQLKLNCILNRSETAGLTVLQLWCNECTAANQMHGSLQSAAKSLRACFGCDVISFWIGACWGSKWCATRGAMSCCNLFFVNSPLSLKAANHSEEPLYLQQHSSCPLQQRTDIIV